MRNFYLETRATELVSDALKKNNCSEAFKSETALALLSLKPQDRILLIDSINLAERLELNDQIREREDRIVKIDLADGISATMKLQDEMGQG